MKNNTDKKEKLHEGHRKRLSAKLRAYGPGVLEDHELLEVLLYSVIPYKDTNPIAKRLIHEFGALDKVFSQKRSELMKISGVGERTAELILLARDVGAFLSPTEKRKIVLDDEESVGKYAVEHFSDENVYKTGIILFDNKMRVLDTLTLFELDYGSAGVRPKAFIDAAINCGAAVAVTVHNHPHGPLFPTPQDRQTNNLIHGCLEMIGVYHIEHYVVCGNGYIGESQRSWECKFSESPDLKAFFRGRERGEAVIAKHKLVSDGEGFKRYKIDYSKELNQALYSSSEEYLAALLSFFAKGKDEKQLSQSLLKRFGSLSAIVGLRLDTLPSDCGIGVNELLKLKVVAYLFSRSKTRGFCIGKTHTREETGEYFSALTLGASDEEIHAIFLDRECRVIATEHMGFGTVNASTLAPRKILEAALRYEAAKIILAHNHPSGEAIPSENDIITTANIANAHFSLGIELIAHYIVAPGEYSVIDCKRLFNVNE